MKMLPCLLLVTLTQLLGVHLLVFHHVGLAEATVVKGGYVFGSDLQNVNFNLETHVWYAFAGVDPTSYKVVTTGDTDIGTFVATVKKSNPHVVPLLSIGGADAPIATFAAMVATSATRKAFIDSSIKVARQYGFEGLDLDWESPQNQLQMANLAKLLKEWRAASKQESHSSYKAELLLTAAVSFQSILLYTGDGNQTWPIDAFSTYLDWANIMCYDYHGSWEPNTTGEYTALYDTKSIINTNYGISNWLQAGLRPDRMCLGLGFYGKEWNLTSLAHVGVDAPASGGGDPIIYRDIVAYNKGGATIVFDATTVSMYSYKPKELTWIGYDNPTTIADKVRYAKSKNLRGYFAWALTQDTVPSTLAAADMNMFNSYVQGLEVAGSVV